MSITSCTVRVRSHLLCRRPISTAFRYRRWAILPNDLSIERGDLTANLKLKRHAVTQRLQSVISALYEGGEAYANVLHIGAAER